MRKIKVSDVMAVLVFMIAGTLFVWWAANQIGNNITQIRGIAADYINEECGTELGYTDVVFDSEGMSVWYILAPVNRSTCNEIDEVKHLWQIPRPGRGDSTPDTPDTGMPRK